MRCLPAEGAAHARVLPVHRGLQRRGHAFDGTVHLTDATQRRNRIFAYSHIRILNID